MLHTSGEGRSSGMRTCGASDNWAGTTERHYTDQSGSYYHYGNHIRLVHDHHRPNKSRLLVSCLFSASASRSSIVWVCTFWSSCSFLCRWPVNFLWHVAIKCQWFSHIKIPRPEGLEAKGNKLCPRTVLEKDSSQGYDLLGLQWSCTSICDYCNDNKNYTTCSQCNVRHRWLVTWPQGTQHIPPNPYPAGSWELSRSDEKI